MPEPLGFRRFNVKHIEEFSKHLIHSQKASAIPPVVLRKSRRFIPRRLLSRLLLWVDQPLDMVLFDDCGGGRNFFADDLCGKG
ncbi:MAG: hypothetical protein R3B95_21095 [Nitrospirales bacterium]|nr:hypothetical protein [Nitrospirales bacterium]